MEEEKSGIDQVRKMFSECIGRDVFEEHAPDIKPGPWNVSKERLDELRKIRLP